MTDIALGGRVFDLPTIWPSWLRPTVVIAVVAPHWAAARARGARGVVGVAFIVGPSGALASFSITRSAGDEILDSAARTLVQSAHFPPPPSGSAHVAASFNDDLR